jgi:hypothetical protein
MKIPPIIYLFIIFIYLFIVYILFLPFSLLFSFIFNLYFF